MNDYIDGNPYRCHHGHSSEEMTKIYVIVLDKYQDECKDSGNFQVAICIKR